VRPSPSWPGLPGPACRSGSPEPELIVEPGALRRHSDGHSVYVAHGSERYTTSRILNAEQFLVDAAVSRATAVDPLVGEAALAVYESTTEVHLDEGQRELVDYCATFPALLAVGIGPAGAGKTTAMRALAEVWAADNRRIVPLATSARAAHVLAGELGIRAENLHKFLHEARSGRDRVGGDEWFRLDAGDVVLVDEVGMAGTRQLAELVARAKDAGALVRLLGDPAQLSAVDAGGALRLLEAEVGAMHLDRLHRFHDPAEAEATLGLRRGDPAAITFYERNNRIRSGTRDAMLDAAYDAWVSDVRTGHTSVLIAASGTDDAALNARARTERIEAGQVDRDGVHLRDGNRAGVGDWVVTRSNQRTLTCRRGRDWVKNGDTWTVTARRRDGSLTVRSLDNRGKVRLPAGYVADSVELAYATTVHRVQGTTVDTAHALITPDMTRESLYVASSRGRAGTHWYAVTEQLLDATSDHEPDPSATTRDVLARVLARSGSEDSATATIDNTLREATSLPTLVACYQNAWQQAAREALRAAAEALLRAPAAAQLIADPGAGKLAAALATAAGRGADPAQVLRAAVELDELANVRSAALVLAGRIEDYPTTVGIPRQPSDGRPLPWLEAPDVGHPGWADYLNNRSQLITARARELGSLAECYREQHHLDHLPRGDLGEPPPSDTDRRAAYDAGGRELQRRRAVPTRSKQSQVRQAGTSLPPAPRLDGARSPGLHY
jgi:AAA domain